MYQINNILASDSYKLSHFEQYPPGTELVSSYIEARGVEPQRDWKEHVFVGLQTFLASGFDKVTQADVDEAAAFAANHGVPFNKDGWQYIVDTYDGVLPIKIQALPEGSVVPLGTPLVQIVNTDSNVPWLTSYLETRLLRAIWYPSTVATQSFHIKRTLKKYLEIQGSSLAGLDFMLHDFGARGVSSQESAAIGGAAHLMVFKGSDTMEGIQHLLKYYSPEEFPGYSVPAAEHSTITSWGKDREVEAYRNMLNKYKRQDGIISIVSDSYNIFDACRLMYGTILKDEIKALGKINCKLVIRPDSGEPKIVLKQILDILFEKFAEDCTKTSEGFSVLPPYIRLLQGDGINERSIKDILDYLAAYGYAAENIVFGMGGMLLQGINRDTLKFAMKANAVLMVGENVWRPVYKDPIGGGKTSKRGRLMVNLDEGAWSCHPEHSNPRKNMLEVMYYDGRYRQLEPTLGTIRKRIDAAL